MRFFKQMSRLALPASALAALTVFWYCEPGNSLNPSTSGPTGRALQVVAIVTNPSSTVSPIPLTPPNDTATIEVGVTDSAAGGAPPAGTPYQVLTDAINFSLLPPPGQASFSSGGFLPASGRLTFRARSGALGPKWLYVIAGSPPGQRRSDTLRFNVTGSLTPPQVTEVYPAQISPADSALVVITVKEGVAPNAIMQGAQVRISSSYFRIMRSSTPFDTMSLDTTDGTGTVSFRVNSAAIGTGTISVTATTPGGVSTTHTLNITVTTQPVLDRPRNMVFTALRSILKADGSDSTLLKVVVKDSNNNPRANEVIFFTSTGGLVQHSDTTDAWGTAYATLISERANMSVIVTANLPKHNLSAQQTVIFDGITIKIETSKRVVRHGNVVDVNFEFMDANGTPMSGDTLEILTLNSWRGFGQRLAGNVIARDSMLVQVDTRGQYKTTITSQVARDVYLEVRALGARTLDTVTFTNNSLSLVSNKTAIFGDGQDQCSIAASLVDSNLAGIPNAELRWTTTFGTFVTTPFTRTSAAGISLIALRAPRGSGLAIVNVEAYDNAGNLIASSNFTIRVLAMPVERLELRVSPDNIPIRVGVSTLIAQAYDSLDNVMADVLIGFRLIKGAGGGDEIIDPPVAYSQAGLAQSSIRAGGVISLYQGVKLAAVALDISGTDTLIIASSDTVGLTFSGPPHKVSVGANILKGLNPNDGTFQLPTAGVVTDVNGNLVADGTPVNFGVHPVIGHYRYVVWRNGSFNFFFRDTVSLDLPWTDYNNNGRLDTDEEPSAFNPSMPARGEDRDGNGRINFAPEAYVDINENGLWDDGVINQSEPQHTWTFLDSLGRPTGNFFTNYVDINGNGRRDLMEPFHRSFNGRDSLITDLNRASGSQPNCRCTGQLDSAGNLYEQTYFGSMYNRPYPGFVSVGIDRQVGTLLGKATTRITYVQTDALRVTARITAESNGIRSTTDVFLPIILGD